MSSLSYNVLTLLAFSHWGLHAPTTPGPTGNHLIRLWNSHLILAFRCGLSCIYMFSQCWPAEITRPSWPSYSSSAIPGTSFWSLYLTRSRLPAVSHKKNFPESRIINSLLTKLVPSSWLDISLVFLRLYGPKRRADIQQSKLHTLSIQRLFRWTVNLRVKQRENRYHTSEQF